MARIISAFLGLVITTLLFISAIYLMFDINWLLPSHRVGLQQLTDLSMDQYQEGHFYLAIAHFIGAMCIIAGTIASAILLPAPLSAASQHLGKLKYALYLLYPLILLYRWLGRRCGPLLKVRMPRPRIEASIQWETHVQAPSTSPTEAQTETRTAPVISLDAEPREPNSAPTPSETPKQEAESGLVYSDPMAESDPPSSATAFDPDAGISIVIDQCRELGFETRSNLKVNAATGGWVPDIFDDNPDASIQLVAVDESNILLIETLDLGGVEWTVETMAQMHDKPWSAAVWKSSHGEIACPVSNLVRSRERFNAALITRLGMEPDQIIPVLMLRNGSLVNPDTLGTFADAEEVEVVWFDNPETIEATTGKAEGKMSAVLLNIMTQASRREAS
jgi:hypothetical protein